MRAGHQQLKLPILNEAWDRAGLVLLWRQVRKTRQRLHAGDRFSEPAQVFRGKFDTDGFSVPPAHDAMSEALSSRGQKEIELFRHGRLVSNNQPGAARGHIDDQTIAAETGRSNPALNLSWLASCV